MSPPTKRSRKSKRGGARPPAGGSSSPTLPAAGSGPLWAPLAITGLLFLLSFVPRVREHPVLLRSFLGATSVLLVWQVVLFARLGRTSAVRSFTTVLRPQHWVQAICQLSVFAYWGWYWRPVYDMAWLIAAQIAFAYAFDMLLAWSRRETYTLGFGPFPIIFSINLFLWFRDDWFYLQFVMIAVGFLGKELVRWTRDGQRRHIFNPSAFSLGLFSIVLLLSGSTRLTWGPEIASTLTLAPNIYAFLFLVGLVVMYFFHITLVAGFAAAVLFGLSAGYAGMTGVPYFVDSEIPAAVFLGLHLLVTDPSTSPKTRLGKAIFGCLYGVSAFGLYAFLGAVGAPRFYDKLLAVPLLNLSVRWIDRVALAISSRAARAPWPAGTPARANLAFMGVWVVFFGVMAATGRTDARHPGDSLPFWEEACREDLRNGCRRLLELESTYCNDNSAWACNELGIHYAEGTIVGADAELARGFFSRACELRFQPGCVNLLDSVRLVRAQPRVLDLRLLLREGGRNLMEAPESELYARACEHAWAFACERTAGRS